MNDQAPLPALGRRFPDHATCVQRLRRLLATRQRGCVHIEGFRSSAVAVLLTDRGGETYLPFTVRSSELRAHSGQISLPGGVREAGDETCESTACREAEEELGVGCDSLDILGVVDDVPTPTGYLITPVVAEMAPPQHYNPNRAEVAEVFEAPLSLFADPEAMKPMGEREFRGIRYRLIAFRYRDYVIWGATARIMAQLAGLVRA